MLVVCRLPYVRYRSGTEQTKARGQYDEAEENFTRALEVDEVRALFSLPWRRALFSITILELKNIN